MIDGCLTVSFLVLWCSAGWRRKKPVISEFQPFQVGYGLASLEFLDTLSATVYWGSIYKLLPVLLDATRCFLVIKLPCKHQYIDWSCHLVFGSSLHMGAMLPRAYNECMFLL